MRLNGHCGDRLLINMSDFQGFEYSAPTKPTYVPPQENEEDIKKNKINLSLEEIVMMNKMKNKKDKSDGKRKRKEISSSDYSSDDDGYKLKGDRRVQYVDLHVPREEINKLCKSLNVDTNGYYVKMEAVLTKRAKH